MYDASDERIWSYKWGASPRFDRWTLRGLGGEVLREYANAGYTFTDKKDYIHRDGQLLASVSSVPAEGTRHFHLDHLGTPRAITSASGALLSYHAYYPFGQEATSPTQDAERMKFTGHERDLASLAGTADDLDSMHARYYSPLNGRFLSVDKHPGRPKRPQGWNRYSYVMGNPMRLVDPTGEFGLPFQLLAEVYVRALNALEGFVQGGRDQIGGGFIPAGPESGSQSPDYEAGRMAASMLAGTNTVMEVSVTADTGVGPAVTGGLALINGNDLYAFLGIGASQSVSPVSGSVATGVVLNYGGPGSYAGPFVGGSTGPLGVGVAGNPFSSRDDPVAVSLVVSTDLGVTETFTIYISLSDLPEEIAQKGGFFFYQGALVRYPAPE
jgi:RHS repeat-associated protein